MKFLNAAGLTPTHLDEAKEYFEQFAKTVDGERSIDLSAFTKMMVPLGLAQKYCRQYFTSMDARKISRLNLQEFLMGLVALDPDTEHAVDEVTGDKRLEFIFDVYDINSYVPSATSS